MTHPIRILALAILAAAAVQVSLPSIASAQETFTNRGVKQHRTPTMSQNIGPNGYFPNQAAARAAHPITQGGTTGGTVNPGLTRDHMQHGYNGWSAGSGSTFSTVRSLIAPAWIDFFEMILRIFDCRGSDSAFLAKPSSWWFSQSNDRTARRAVR
jgi:hypothetical protein